MLYILFQLTEICLNCGYFFKLNFTVEFAVSEKKHSFASSLDKQLSLDRDREMAERSNAAVLKTVELRGSGGSNPSLSAKAFRFIGRLFCF